MVHIVQPSMIGDVADMFARSVAAQDQEKTKPDGKTSPRPGNDRAEAAPSGLPSPSTNGGNGHKKTAEPSANGGNGRAKPLPPWLEEIAARMPPPSPSHGKGHRQGRKKR
jgi:hypothetical protein